MTNPLAVITASTILNLAFQEFTKVGAGDLARKSLNGAIDLAKDLRDKLRARFQGDAKAEIAFQSVETENSLSALKKLEVYLDDAMTDDSNFAEELRQVAQQIINIQNENIDGNRVYNQTAGRDVINVESIKGGSNKFGGS